MSICISKPSFLLSSVYSPSRFSTDTVVQHFRQELLELYTFPAGMEQLQLAGYNCILLTSHFYRNRLNRFVNRTAWRFVTTDESSISNCDSASMDLRYTFSNVVTSLTIHTSGSNCDLLPVCEAVITRSKFPVTYVNLLPFRRKENYRLKRVKVNQCN
jgi:hypothetical protein